MKNTQSLPDVIGRIYYYLRILEEEIIDSGLPVARQSQTGVRQSIADRPAPMDLRLLDYLLDTADPIIKGWAVNLAYSTPGLTLPLGSPNLSDWCLWLHQHADLLGFVPWLPDCTQELCDLQAELQCRIFPDSKPHSGLPDYATVEEIAEATGRSREAIYKWCARNGVTAYFQGGKRFYKTSQVV